MLLDDFKIPGKRLLVKGNMEMRTDVTGAKKLQLQPAQITAPTITIGAPNGGPNLLPLITSALNDIKSALDIVADHTHPSDNTASSDASAIHAKAAGVGGTNTSLQTLQ